MNIVLFYPRLGWMDTFILDLPLSIIYAAHKCQQHGIEVRYIDQRIVGSEWREKLAGAIDDKTVLIGFSVMSGSPLRFALDATRYCKTKYPHLPTVWGGMHVTIRPEEAARDADIDYIVRGLGSNSLYLLTLLIGQGKGKASEIPGLGWKEDTLYRENGMQETADYPPLAELSYSGLDWDRYTRFNYKERVYSLFTSFGCPHKCKFCFAPIFWKSIKGRKWFPYAAEDVIDHVALTVSQHNIGYISMLDENFLLDLPRATIIFRGLLARNVKVHWGIRGARIDDLDRADDEFMRLLVEVGVRQIMIGAESGSPRMLEAMKKGITVQQIIRVNKKLARYPQLNPSYNFLSGLPGEEIEDLFKSVDLILTMIQDNPSATFSGLNQLIPFPGSDLFDQCVAHGYRMPTTLEGWAGVDTHYNDMKSPWLDQKFEKTLHAIQAALMFVDYKAERELTGSGQSCSRGIMMDLIYSCIGWITRLYRPIARWRLRNHCFAVPIDYGLIKVGVKLMHWMTLLRKAS